MDEKPLEKTIFLDFMFAEIWKWLEDEKWESSDCMEWGCGENYPPKKDQQ